MIKYFWAKFGVLLKWIAWLPVLLFKQLYENLRNKGDH